MTQTRTVHIDENGNLVNKKNLSYPLKGRIFTIAYEVYPEGKLKYAGCVFNPDCKKDLEELIRCQEDLLHSIQTNKSNDPKSNILQYAKLEAKKLNLQKSHWNSSGNVKTALARLELRPLWTSIPKTYFNEDMELVRTDVFCQRIRNEVKHKGIKSPYRVKTVTEPKMHLKNPLKIETPAGEVHGVVIY